MATRAAALAAMVAVSGCKYGPDAFNCTDDTSCGAAGRCEENHACSFPDITCISGRKYGELGGADSGKCVGDALAPDAGVVMADASADVAADARVCFGDAPFTICLASPPTASLALAPASPIDTTSSALCVATVSGGTNSCVLVGTTITIEGKLRATGTRPLVLVASDSITVTGTIDVGSHRGATPETGAGSDFSGCPTGTLPGSSGGGGAGGSFVGLGGNGGAGGNGGSGGVAGAASGTVTTVRGGCPGQDGQGGGEKGLKGHGGGAVFLIAGNQIAVQASAVINAAGEGGTGATNNASGGGGAGAGGMIGFDAPTITCATGALLLATGGGGGEGANNAGFGPTAGLPGADPTTTAAANGGAGLPDGGDGGRGAIDAATAGGTGGTGDSGGVVHGGGGGGGGGAGLIMVASSGAFCTQLAPPASR